MKSSYPCLEMNLTRLGDNIRMIKDICDDNGIKIAGVIKGFSGFPEAAAEYEKAGIEFIASSRLEHLEGVKKAGISTPCMCIRISMLTELDRLVRCAEISLQSEKEVLKALDRAAGDNGKKHEVILMADLGDLREGFWDDDELVSAAMMVENSLDNLELAGIGTNLGCYGAIEATREKMTELIKKAELIEKNIGRKLKYISGGATSSIPRLMNGDMPERINMLRLGEGMVFAKDLQDFFGCDMSFMHKDVFTLKAEIIEVKTKPSHPVGNIIVDAFGRRHEYTDKGMRKRALAAIGKVDYGDPGDLSPRMKGVEIVGASSDHTILDVQDAEKDIKVGDILEFDIRYSSGVYVTDSPNVRYVFTV